MICCLCTTTHWNMSPLSHAAFSCLSQYFFTCESGSFVLCTTIILSHCYTKHVINISLPHSGSLLGWARLVPFIRWCSKQAHTWRPVWESFLWKTSDPRRAIYFYRCIIFSLPLELPTLSTRLPHREDSTLRPRGSQRSFVRSFLWNMHVLE